VRQQGERFVVLDAAITPDKPASPNRMLISLAGLFGGIFAGIALAAVAEINDQSIRTEKQIIAIFGTRVLSDIPLISSRRQKVYQRLTEAGLLVGTIAGSAAFGFFLSIVSNTFF
jgi:hypothetical protein